MRSIGAVALVLAIITECFGAQSDRSRQRSGPIRSVPVAADIKRDIDFDCPEEFGYYPHPNDCTLYYVCVFGGALLESCTGGLMYSHELQTCDWPRNVGCDGLSAAGGEELERISEREPPPRPLPPRRTPPPPPPRVQPNPVITSRGQPKFNRQEYEKQQQLYAEVDDLPPVEEIETDRQQRVYRGQPSTIGQVQKDRDGYSQISSSRALNSNIIPSSISQSNGKIGSFSFGTQVDDRRSASITQAPQTYSLEPTESVSPVSYSASPRPKMLYNGSQTYNPDQYDPFYAVYDEDGELYKDTVQQTYRGTPPPARRPVETYTRRPVSADDYDDALIQGQIGNHNQYQSAIRHSTRGDGNELGFDNNPSSVKTTFYEATSISTTPSTTTSTSTTTQRTTTAPLTEAMTPSRYTVRSSTVESPMPSLYESPNPQDESKESEHPTLSNIYLSSQAKPFAKTDNSHRLKQTLLTTEIPLISKYSSQFIKNDNNITLDVVPNNNIDGKKVLPLTSGFSIRRNVNNSDNTYTFTLLTHPVENMNKTYNFTKSVNNEKPVNNNHNHDVDKKENMSHMDSFTNTKYEDTSNEESNYREDIKIEYRNKPVLIRSKLRRPASKRILITTEPTKSINYVKGVIRKPITSPNTPRIDSIESFVSTADPSFLMTPSEIPKVDFLWNHSSSSLNEQVETQWDKKKGRLDNAVSLFDNRPLETPLEHKDIYPDEPHSDSRFDNYRSHVKTITDSSAKGLTTAATLTRALPISTTRNLRIDKPRSKSSYYAYSVDDEIVPDHTTEVFSGKVKNVLRAFFNNFASTPTPRLLQEFSVTTVKTTTQPEEKVINIGFQKKILKYDDEKPLRNNIKRLQIITEPSINKVIPSQSNLDNTKQTENINEISSLLTTSSPISLFSTQDSTAVMRESAIDIEYSNIPIRQSYKSTEELSSKLNADRSKFYKLLQIPATESDQFDNAYNKVTEKLTSRLNVDSTQRPIEIDWNRPTEKVLNEIVSTTGTTKSTSTVRVEPVTVTKSLPFPTRASRVNPAIKLAASNPGGGRRSYQTPTKCSSDDSLQANPKCNEIKYQRPTSTRGRGSAHYSTGSEAPQPIPNRGTPPTRSRPTLKPSTAIVSKSSEFVDIYGYPPSRPPPVYPQPTPDKTAAKCRKDVCLLPDCYCGGKDIPGDLTVETVPQIVLLTFDDSVNDLNKGLYMDLFEKGRVNPNGCPISATFYVSHEWTDYSQVQNLYAAGHEMASHTVSHSFGEQFSQKKWNREVGGQREILAAYGGVKLEDVRGMRAPFLSVGGNKMFKMLYDSNFTYDSSLPVYENRPPSWPYTLDYKLFHDCMIPPCPTKSYPGVWEVPMVMWQDLNGGRCSMGDACANPPDAEGVYKMILKNFDRHYTTNRAPFGLYYHAAWFTQPHHKEGFIMFLDFINQMNDVWIITNWQALQWVRDPTPISRLNNFQPFQCNYQDRPKKCNNPKVCNLWHKSGVRYMRTCQPCPEVYPWTGKTGIKSSRIDNDIGE
ncbi:hypothetical protein ACJJTC_015615 [Scirpophaga incertulas]